MLGRSAGAAAAALAAAFVIGPGAYGAALCGGFDNPCSHDPQQQFGPVDVQRQDTPNDPEYDNAEPDTAGVRDSTSLYDERYDLFGFASALVPAALYLEGPHVAQKQIAGFNAAGAWKLERGRPDVNIAILDTGIRWSSSGLRDRVALNTGELPIPQDANGDTNPGAAVGGRDLNGNGWADVDDYAADPRVLVVKPAAQAKITGRDLIHAFSDGTDADGNGYVDDIAGWDFFGDDNDPNDDASYFAASNHGTGRANNAVEEGNDGSGSIGVCPRCTFVPLRIWDTFVSDGDTVGMAMLYAADNGIEVLEGSNGSTYHSAFTEAASRYAWEHGVAQVYSGDDLNTGNHNWPANYSHVMEIQGTVPDTFGLGTSNELGFGIPVGTNAPPSTFFRGGNTTQFGGHSSISMTGSTGSQNTGLASGAVGLVISAARDRGVDLTADETRAILEQTAEDVLQGNTLGITLPDPAQVGWDEHFGYGRADVGKAVGVAANDKIPPEAAISTPDWYEPLIGASAHLTGLARARFATGGAFHLRVEWGPGLAPTSWTTIVDRNASGTVSDLGTLDLAAVRSALDGFVVPVDPAGPTFAPNAENPFSRQFTVRVTVTGTGIATPGVDRKVLTALDDDTLRPGYPRRMGTGGEAPIRYADLDGDGAQELVVPLEDGQVHAFTPGGGELPGWPVHTQLFSFAQTHMSAPGLEALDAPPREPLRGAAIADLDGDGTQEVIDAAGRHLYVWEPDGTLRPGFPVEVDPALCRPEDQSQPLHHRKCGFVASPALARLDGPGKPLSIVAAALDGHVYGWKDDGTRAFAPVNLVDPEVPPAEQMLAESINDPAVGDLNGDGIDDIVVASNEAYGGRSPDAEDLNGAYAQAVADITSGALGGSSRVYAINGKTRALLPGWPIKLNGAIQDTLPLVGPGHDAELVKVGGEQLIAVSTTGGALAMYDVAGHLVRAAQQGTNGALSNLTDRSPVEVNLFESASVGDVLGVGRPALVKYALTLGGLVNLAAAGANVPYNHTIGAFDAETGAPLPAWPTITDDFQFLAASNVASVDPTSPANQVVAGTGLGLLHAYDGGTGLDVSGFPKHTGGWLFAPAALSDDGRIADITREGFLFEWDVDSAPCQPEWPSFRHDDHQTGNYDADGTAPGAPGGVAVAAAGGTAYTLAFNSPGDDGACGTAAKYAAQVDGQPADVGLGTPAAGGSRVTRTIDVPADSKSLSFGAVDDAGNTGPFATVVLPPQQGGGTTTTGGGTTTGGSTTGGGTTTGGSTTGGGTTTGGSTTGGGTTTGGSTTGGTTTGGTTGGTTGMTTTNPPPDTSAPAIEELTLGTLGTICTRAAPQSRIASVRGKSRVTISGTAERGSSCGALDALDSVEVSVALKSGGRCRFADALGTLGRVVSCRRTRYATAVGVSSFRLTLRSLPHGHYQVWSRAIDLAGDVEHKNRSRNFRRFTLR